MWYGEQAIGRETPGEGVVRPTVRRDGNVNIFTPDLVDVVEEDLYLGGHRRAYTARQGSHGLVRSGEVDNVAGRGLAERDGVTG